MWIHHNLIYKQIKKKLIRKKRKHCKDKETLKQNNTKKKQKNKGILYPLKEKKNNCKKI